MPKPESGRAARETGPAPQRAKAAEVLPTDSPSLRHLAPGAIVQRATAAPQALRPAEMMALQRTIGNRAMGAMLGRHTPNTGLPDDLKVGIESLSGVSMDGVTIQYNSSQPAQLGALAYTQGTNIHVAPGQEQQLPHEAWHVVQQQQGRVQPTMRLAESVSVNDDAGLELEADRMGTRAAQMRNPGTDAVATSVEQTRMRLEAPTARHLDNAMPVTQQMNGPAVVQRKLDFDQRRLKNTKIKDDTKESKKCYKEIKEALKLYYISLATSNPLEGRQLDPNSLAIRQRLVDIEDLCAAYLKLPENAVMPRSQMTSARRSRVAIVQDLEAAARLEWGHVSSLVRSLAAVEDPSGSTDARNLYFLAQFMFGDPIRSAEKQVTGKFARKFGLEVIDLTAIKLFSLNDYKYINPAIANDIGWATKQLSKVKLREEASSRLDRHIEGILDQSKSPPESRNLPQERIDARLQIMQKEGRHLASLVNRALNKLPAVPSIKVYRGARMSHREFETVYGIRGEKAAVTKYSYSSTTNPEVAQEYAAKPAAEGRLNSDQTLSVLCEMKVNSARNIRDISMVPTENEVVVLVNTKFKMTGFKRELSPQSWMGKFMRTEPSEGNPKITEWIHITAEEIDDKQFQDLEKQRKKAVAQERQNNLAANQGKRRANQMQTVSPEFPLAWYEDSDVTLAAASVDQAALDFQALLDDMGPHGNEPPQLSEVSQRPTPPQLQRQPWPTIPDLPQPVRNPGKPQKVIQRDAAQLESEPTNQQIRAQLDDLFKETTTPEWQHGALKSLVVLMEYGVFQAYEYRQILEKITQSKQNSPIWGVLNFVIDRIASGESSDSARQPLKDVGILD